MKAVLLLLLCQPFFLFGLTVSRETLYKKINSPPPEWMIAQIEEDLSAFQETGITKQMIDDTIEEVSAVFTGRGAQFVRYKIKDNHISYTSLTEKKNDVRLGHFLEFIEQMGRYVKLPDIEFLATLWDSYDRPVFLEKTQCPVFTMCKLMPNRIGVLFPETRFYDNRAKIFNQIASSIQWSKWEKKIEKAFWRGGTTGMLYTPFEWDFKPRPRLVLYSIDHPDLVDARFTYVWWIDEKMQKTFKDYNFFSAWTGPENWVNHKYLIAVDGNTFASSFWWELLSNCVVLKSDSEFVEWFYKGVKPYEHYVPYNPDCSDLAEKIHWLREHDDQAHEMANHAAKFAKEHLSTEGMMLYFYTLFNAYAKLQRD